MDNYHINVVKKKVIPQCFMFAIRSPPNNERSRDLENCNKYINYTILHVS